MAKPVGSRVAAMRTPFDDVVFSAYARRHGLTPDMAPAAVGKCGWNGDPKGPRTGMPEDFPRFVFNAAGQGIGAVLVVYLHHNDGEPMVRYGHSPGGTWVHVDTTVMPATLGVRLEGRTIGEVVDIPGIAEWVVAAVTEENGTITMRIKPPKPPGKRKEAA